MPGYSGRNLSFPVQYIGANVPAWAGMAQANQSAGIKAALLGNCKKCHQPVPFETVFERFEVVWPLSLGDRSKP